MNWKLKAYIQNSISMLPHSLSYSVYYWIQRRFGGWRNTSPVSQIEAAVQICEKISEHNQTIVDKVILEVGTGRIAMMPIAYWLMGAKKIITIDLNPYLKSELVKEYLNYLFKNKNEIMDLFGTSLVLERFDRLEKELERADTFSVDRVLEICNIEYKAPWDAAKTGLPNTCIDYHTSFNVFEHIPDDELKKILCEAKRILRKNGLLIHKIDYSDHFSHSDHSISSINFLQYSDIEWKKYANNKYMYMNRLRHDDFISLYKSTGIRVIQSLLTKDNKIHQLLVEKKLDIDEKFNSKSESILLTTEAWIISQI